MQAAIVGWQADGATAEQIGAAMAAAPSMSGQGTMGDENMPDAMASTGYALRLLDPTVFDPVIAGESLGSYDPAVPSRAPGVLLQPDRELGAAFFGDHAARLAAAAPQIDVVEVHGVGHLIHDSRTHRGEYLSQLRTVPRHVGPGMIVDPHHHLWVHPTNPYMAPELHADTATRRRPRQDRVRRVRLRLPRPTARRRSAPSARPSSSSPPTRPASSPASSASPT